MRNHAHTLPHGVRSRKNIKKAMTTSGIPKTDPSELNSAACIRTKGAAIERIVAGLALDGEDILRSDVAERISGRFPVRSNRKNHPPLPICNFAGRPRF